MKPPKLTYEEAKQDKLLMHCLRNSSFYNAWKTAQDLRKIFSHLNDEEILEEIKHMNADDLFYFRMKTRPNTLARLCQKFKEASS